MSDRPIQVGDMVQIVGPRDCCPRHTAWGHIFIANAIFSRAITCAYCYSEMGTYTLASPNSHTYEAVPLHRLKRIPPLDELEGQQTEESIRQPTKVM